MFARRTKWKLASNRLSTAWEKLRRSGREVLELTESNPTRCGLKYNSEAILKALADPAALTYQPIPKGLLSARQAVAQYYIERDDGAEVDPENIILTTSTSEAYSFIFRQLCDAGDEVLAPVPSYPLFEFLADLQDVKLVPYSLIYDHGWQIDLHSVEKAVTARTRAIVVVHPNNPTGSYVKREEAARLVELCAKHELAVIADEVFLDYSHDSVRKRGGPEDRQFSFAGNGLRESGFSASRSFGNNAALTFALSGLSKISALPQMKFAWMVVSGPTDLVGDAMARLEIIADTYLSMNTPVQLAAPVLLEQRHDIRRQLLERITVNLAELDWQIAGHPMCSRLEVEGGWYAVLRVPATQSGEEFTVRLVERDGVLVHPGDFYDFPAEGYLVISLITPVEVFREGLGRVLAAG